MERLEFGPLEFLHLVSRCPGESKNFNYWSWRPNLKRVLKMARTVQTTQAEDLAGLSGFLEAEGVYHFIVEEAKDGIKMNIEEAFDGFSVRLKVLHGPEEGKTTYINLMDGQESHKDGGKACNAKQCAFLVASNLLTPDQLKGAQFSFDEQNSIGAQIIADFRLGKPNDKGKRYLELHYSNIYHVDDPRSASVAKDASWIAKIPAGFRRKPEFFASIQPKKNAPATTKPAAELDLGGI